LLKTVSRYGEPLQERKLTVAEVMHRLDTYYHPYQRELKAVMDRMTSRRRLLLQPVVPLHVGGRRADARRRGKERMDFCIGNLKGTTSSNRVHRVRRRDDPRTGFTSPVNTPYSGGELNRRYGDTSGKRDSLMSRSTSERSWT
jgi:N-formylglutamate deformylase